MATVTKLLPKCLACFAFFVLGVLVNYHGLISEIIRVEVAIENSSSTATAQELQHKNYLSNESAYVVPNIVHFIWFGKTDNDTMSFVNYVSILSAHKFQRPDVIMLHCNFLPAGEWWVRLWHDVPLQIVYREPPQTIHGQKLKHVFHKGDVAKLEILLEYGGIYLDYDVIVVNNMDEVRKYDATMGKEKYPKFIAGIIVGKKGSLFLRLLYESYRRNYRSRDWDYNCARIAYAIYLQRPDLLHVEPFRFTTPDWEEKYLLWREIIAWKRLYVVHLMTHEMYEAFDPEKIKTLNSTFGQVMRYVYYDSPDLIAKR